MAAGLDRRRPPAVLRSVTEEKLAAKLAKATERLEADAPGMERSGADLIAWYLSPDRLPVGEQWSRKHAHTQRRLCERFVVPVIGSLACQDIRSPTCSGSSTPRLPLRKAAVSMPWSRRWSGRASAAGTWPTPGRRRCTGRPGKDRPAAAPKVTVAGESPLFVDPAEIPGHADVGELGQALAERESGVYELMAQLAAYSGLRWGELAALTIGQVDLVGRVITVDRKVIEIGGRLYEESPKNRSLCMSIPATCSCSTFIRPATSCSGSPHLMGQGRAAARTPASAGD